MYTILLMTIKDNNIQKLIKVNLSSTIYKHLLPTTNLYTPYQNTSIDQNNFVNGNKPNNLNSNVCTLGYAIFSSPITEIKILSMMYQTVIVIYKLFFANT